MRKFSLIFLLCILCVTLQAQFNLPFIPGELTNYSKILQDRTNKGIHAKTDVKYVVSGSTVTSVSYKESITKYESSGRIKEIIFLNQQGQTESITIFSYNQENLPELATIYYPDGTVLGRTKYTYNANHCITDITETDQYEYIISKRVFVTDNDKQTVTELFYVEEDSVLNKTVYYFDNIINGIKVKEEYYEGPVKMKYAKNIIRKSDKVVKEEFMDETNNIYYSLIYTYDSNENNTVIEKELPGGNRIKHIMYRYDIRNNITGYTLFQDSGGIRVYYKYTYE